MNTRFHTDGFPWLVAGNATIALSQWFIVLIASKLGGPAAAGRYAYALAICTPIVVLTGLQLRAIQASDAAGEYSFADYLTLRSLTLIVAAAVVAIAAFLHAGSGEFVMVLLIVGMIRFTESISETVHGHLLRQARFRELGGSLILRGSGAALAFACAFAAFQSLLGAVAAAAAVTLAVLVVYDLSRVRSIGWFSLAPNRQLQLLRMSSPLGVTSLMLSLQANAPRYLIKAALGEAALGIYAALAQLPLSAAVLVRAMGEASSPALARHYRSGHAGQPALLFQLCGYTSLLFIAGAAIAFFMGEPLLRLLYTPEHASFVGLLLLLIAAEYLAQLTSILGYAATAARRLKPQPWVVLAALSVLLGLGFSFGASASLSGMAAIVIISTACMLAGYFFLVVQRGDPWTPITTQSL